jgi:hypothetical protein
MRYDNGGTLKNYFVQISQTLQNKGLSRLYQKPQRLWNIVLLVCKQIWKVLRLSWSNVGYWAGRNGLATGINEHKKWGYE